LLSNCLTTTPKKQWIRGSKLYFSPAQLLRVGIAFFALYSASGETRTLRIVTYNIEADTGGFSTARPGLVVPYNGGSVLNGGVLEGVGEESVGSDPAQPIDILALQETTSNNTTVAPIVSALNTYYNSAGMYAMSTYQATSSGGISSGGGPNALIYNTRTVQLLASVPVDPPGGTSQLGSSSGEYREVMRYQFAPAGVTPAATNQFYIYVSHYKASTGPANETARAGEAQIIRNNSATLPANARILYVGDYNPTGGSSEAGYQTIIAPGINQGIDPMNPSGATGISWDVDSLMDQKTESAPDLRYRDDLQIMTTNVFYGQAGGLTLVSGTYHVFGNNGTTPYQGSVSVGNSALTNIPAAAPIDAATLYRDLTNASDHLPVVADYTVPVPAPALPGLKLVNFIFSSNSGFQFAVSNMDGTQITVGEQARIGILMATNLAQPLSSWKAITNSITLSNGLLQVSDTNRAGSPQRFYRAVGR
jgi:endonuclease/exonuclease/phosphatase family metal-dependent hydrolase